MSKAKKIALGIAIILAAIASAVVAFLDDDPATKVEPGKVVEEVNEGVNEIKGAKEDAKPVGVRSKPTPPIEDDDDDDEDIEVA